MSAPKNRWYQFMVRAPVIVAVEIPAHIPEDEVESYAENTACWEGNQPYPCACGKFVADGIPCVEGDRFHEVFPLTPPAPSKDWNTDGDVKADKLTGGAR